MKVAIIGARLAGSYAALLLTQAGHEVVLFDGSTAREKPCGGGVTPKALRTIPWFRQNPLPHCEVRTLRMTHLDGTSGKLHLAPPIHVFSRLVLDTALREAAIQAGAVFVPQRATAVSESQRGWEIAGSSHAAEADFLIGADGAGSTVRARTAGRFRPSDLSLALGFCVPGRHHPDTAVVEFQEPGFEGYLWSFPRPDHTSVGILRRLPSADSQDLKRRVRRLIAARYPEHEEGMQFYAARIPCLTASSLLRQRVCGRTWALLGDAAGFADPITAEGIYFALRSAELLAKSIERDTPGLYEDAWRRDFGYDFLRAARWHDRFYCGSFLFSAFTRRLIQLTSGSGTLQRLCNAVVAGRLGYGAFRRSLMRTSPRVLVEYLAARRGRPGRRANPA